MKLMHRKFFRQYLLAVKDDIIDCWIATHKEYEAQDVKTVYYLSMEFLMGQCAGQPDDQSGKLQRDERSS